MKDKENQTRTRLRNLINSRYDTGENISENGDYILLQLSVPETNEKPYIAKDYSFIHSWFTSWVTRLVKRILGRKH